MQRERRGSDGQDMRMTELEDNRVRGKFDGLEYVLKSFNL